jgi:hypothetical protein
MSALGWQHRPDNDPDGSEPLSDGGTWLLDLVAAVDHLRRGHRPDFTVWDAFEEALRWSIPDSDLPAPGRDVADPLAATLHKFVDQSGPLAAERMQRAVRRWVEAMTARYNNGHHWAHPQPRRGFPPPLVAAIALEPDGSTHST